MSSRIRLASHEQPADFWSGERYELNLSFQGLQDRQWRQLIDEIWAIEDLRGPLPRRYVPTQAEPTAVSILYPEPTAAFVQHAAFSLDDFAVGAEVLITRSMFECISLQIPLAMFAPKDETKAGELKAVTADVLKAIFKSIALRLYLTITFKIGTIGFNRECQLVDELLGSEEAHQAFLQKGDVFIEDALLAQMGQNHADYETVLPGLRWLPPA